MRSLSLGARALASACALALLGPAAADAAVSPPQVHSPDGAARGTVIVIHGGSWWATGEPIMATTRPMAQRFADWGWRAVNADYGPGAAGADDLRKLLDAELDRAGRRPVCLYGESAGGQWALMLAAWRRQVGCVMAIAAPTELEDLTPGSGLEQLISTVFTPEQRSRFNPARHGHRIAARMLLGYAADDPIIPVAHGLRMDATVRGADLHVVDPGPAPWIHGSTGDPAQLGAMLHSMRRTLTAAQRRAEGRAASRKRSKKRAKRRPPARADVL